MTVNDTHHDNGGSITFYNLTSIYFDGTGDHIGIQDSEDFLLKEMILHSQFGSFVVLVQTIHLLANMTVVVITNHSILDFLLLKTFLLFQMMEMIQPLTDVIISQDT